LDKMLLSRFWTSISLVVVSFFCQNAEAEVYSSAADMMEVFKLERELVSIMDGFASKLQSKLNKINNYIEVNILFF
jgi:hypothetical protein